MRTSITVSRDFILPRHSSPSFGSYHTRSTSNPSLMEEPGDVATLRKRFHISGRYKYQTIHFHFASEFDTLRLARMLDSLVRVSRRVNKNSIRSETQSFINHWTTTHRIKRDDTADQKSMLSDTTRAHIPITTMLCSTADDLMRRPDPTVLIPLLQAVSSTFDSLFKVLFTFPLRYLCAIGLFHVFSFRRNLPPV
jgi:hypothetical protein